MQGPKGSYPSIGEDKSQWGCETPTCMAGSWADAILPRAELRQWAQHVLVTP